jgi:hypothetical protein
MKKRGGGALRIKKFYNLFPQRIEKDAVRIRDFKEESREVLYMHGVAIMSEKDGKS